MPVEAYKLAMTSPIGMIEIEASVEQHAWALKKKKNLAFGFVAGAGVRRGG